MPGFPGKFMKHMSETSYTQRFTAYFDREVAARAAKSLSDGAEIEFRVGDETFTFTRENRANKIVPGSARAPQVTFTLPPAAAEEVLNDPTDEVGEIGVRILKLITSSDSSRKVHLKLNSGFLSLMTKGYLGVLASGGSGVASYLASRGLGGAGAIKMAIKRMKD